MGNGGLICTAMPAPTFQESGSMEFLWYELHNLRFGNLRSDDEQGRTSVILGVLAFSIMANAIPQRGCIA